VQVEAYLAAMAHEVIAAAINTGTRRPARVHKTVMLDALTRTAIRTPDAPNGPLD